MPGEVSGLRYARESFIAAQVNNQVIAPFCYEGTCDANLFNYWLENFLLPELVPGSIVILDNASIHKSEETLRLISQARCQLLFLPLYSPDLNPIEHVWAQLKSKIRRMTDTFITLADAIDCAFRAII